MVIKNRVDTLNLKTGAQIGGFVSDFPYIYDVDIEGDYAFMTNRTGFSDNTSIMIFDISNPSDSLFLSSELSSYAVGGATFFAVDAVGTYAYVASGAGLIVFDVSDPANPAIAGSLDTPGTARDVFVEGNYAFVADNEAGLQIIDITDPANPDSVGNYTYTTADSARGVFVSGNTAYVAYGGSGLVIVNVAQKNAPSLISSYNTPGFAQDVVVDASYAYVADHSNGGLQIIDITSPADPVLAGQYNSPGGASGVFVNANYIFMADRWNGLLVFEFQP
jgi:hypothetical protein